MRKMILADSLEDREDALAELEPMQQKDFEGLYEIMDGMNVNVHLLDPPLHEFLPQEENLIKELADAIDKSAEEVKERIDDLHEANPMMGHRGCRLAVTYPEISNRKLEQSLKPQLP